MSKQIKQLEMDALAQTFTGVRDLVMMSVTGMKSSRTKTSALVPLDRNWRSSASA